MLIYPAIDLRGGRVVRLTQGDYDRMTVYGDDPVDVAQGFVQAGATCLHAVDLDGAKDGSPQNRTVIGQLCKLPLSIEVGGGMRTEADVDATLALGADRVILGTVAVEDFGMVERLVARWGARIAVGVDARGGKVATRGWREVSGPSTDSMSESSSEPAGKLKPSGRLPASRAARLSAIELSASVLPSGCGVMVTVMKKSPRACASTWVGPVRACAT